MEPIFKPYQQHQQYLLPPSLEELIEDNHPVRVVNTVIDKLDISPLTGKYKGGGTSSYHPVMLLKVIVYSYLSNIYSSRKMESALKENIHFMWLGAMNRPDHNTINDFRSNRLKDVMKEIFVQVVKLLVESGHVSLQEVYTDGTKIEANANRYTFVWGKAIKTSRKKMEEQLRDLWGYAERVTEKELGDKEDTEFEAVDPKKMEQTIDKINEAIKDKEAPKKVKQKIKYIKKNWPSQIEKYNQQETILEQSKDHRNSYSKTDNDATFMRMKEDHMLNGQLKPGYNLQISTNEQIIVNYSVHEATTDTTTLKGHIESFVEAYNKAPEVLVADAGYGSEENYETLEKHQIKAYVKYNSFDREQRKLRGKEAFKNSFKPENLHYNKEKDCFYCPMGQKMEKVGTQNRTTANGYKQLITIYQAQRCEGCPLRVSCHKQKGDRQININHSLRDYKQKVRGNLLSEQGIKYRKKRPWDVEPVFGNIKYNKKFKRYNLRGIRKVEIETGLIAIAHNLSKIAA
jgi:transposase